MTTTEPSFVFSVLEWLTPLAAALSMVAVGVAAIVCRSEAVNLFQGLGTQGWQWLAIIVGIALLIRLTLVPATERVFYDEHTYLQIARGIAEEGRARAASYALVQPQGYETIVGSYPHWSTGWPTLVAGALYGTGYARWTGQLVNLILSLTAVVLVALMASMLFPGTFVGPMSAAAYASFPANQLWSRTSASEIFAACAATLAVIAALRFAQNPSRRLGFMLAASLAMAVQIRNEAIFLVPVCAMFIAFQGGWESLKKACWPAVALMLVLIPQGIHLGTISRGYEPHVEGAGFGVRYFLSNFSSVVDYLTHEPVFLTCLILAVLGAPKVQASKLAIPFWIWWFCALGIPMFHFGGSFAFPGGERFVLASLPPLAISSGVGLYALHVTLESHIPSMVVSSLWVGLILGGMVWVAPYVIASDQETGIPRADTVFLQKAIGSVPEEGIIVTADPPVVIAEGRSAVFIVGEACDSMGLSKLAAEYQQKLYYYVSPSSSPTQWAGGQECEQRLLSRFHAKSLVEEASPEGQRVLYTLSEKVPT
ncbi:MAG: glycosyltransferase family 39 protein [Bryobacterales bacterium]